MRSEYFSIISNKCALFLAFLFEMVKRFVEMVENISTCDPKERCSI